MKSVSPCASTFLSAIVVAVLLMQMGCAAFSAPPTAPIGAVEETEPRDSLPGAPKEPEPEPPAELEAYKAEICNQRPLVIADVVALDQPIVLNRSGATIPGGMIFALQRDVVSTLEDTEGASCAEVQCRPGCVRLRDGKRPRPIVLRVNEGNCLQVNFTNLLSPNPSSFPVGDQDTLEQPFTRTASIHIQGVNWLEGPEDDGSNVGRNPSSLAQPGESKTYRLFAEHEGPHLLYSTADDWTALPQGFKFARGAAGGNGGALTEGLFGAVHIQPAGYRLYTRYQKILDLDDPGTLSKIDNAAQREPADLKAELLEQFGETAPEDWQAEWYRSQVTEQDLCLASSDHNYDPLTEECTRANPGKLPEIDYQAVYPANYHDESRRDLPILNMLRCQQRSRDGKYCIRGEVVHSDITAVITGPSRVQRGETPFHFPPDFIAGSDVGPLRGVEKDPSLRPAYSYPERREPYREFTVIYHESFQVNQAFGFYYNHFGTLLSAADNFGINYGMQGLSTPILANRLGAGPLEFCSDCKYEEFFLQSWTQGDPDMVVDFPSTACIDAQGEKQWPSNCKDCEEKDAGTPYYVAPDCPSANKVFYPDDPSNVFPSYMFDHLKFRILHGGPDLHHLHHQHAHQWIASPNTPDGDYLDSQSIGPGSSFTLEMVYHGSGNVNQTVGDSIFHCHFYPHFASGMWALWRVLDTFESGTKLTDYGTVVAGARAYPDAEITAGTPIPAVVPVPTLPMAPMPAPVRLTLNPETERHDVQVCLVDEVPASGTCADNDPNWVFATATGTGGSYEVEDALNPGYPFFIPGIAGSRAPHPPLDFAWALSCPDKKPPHGEICEPPEAYSHRQQTVRVAAALPPQGPCQCEPLDGGLPRNVFISGETTSLIEQAVEEGLPLVENGQLSLLGQFANVNFSKEIETATAFQLPETGTLIEGVAMKTHATRFHATKTPEGQPGEFILNGLPPVPGAPYADPCIQFRRDGGEALGLPKRLYPPNLTSRYLATDLQLDAIFNKDGWHFPQQRIISLWGDVFDYLEGGKPPEPLFLRANSYDCVEYVLANLVPNVYELDDFQVRTPTDVLGQHIHLVKFDVTSSDGASNGWNYEDGTFAPNEVTERILALNKAYWECKEDPYCEDGTRGLISPDRQHSIELKAKYIPFFGPGPVAGDTSWVGSQATVQRWYADPLLNNFGICTEDDKLPPGPGEPCTSVDFSQCPANADHCDASGGLCSDSVDPGCFEGDRLERLANCPTVCTAADNSRCKDPNALCISAFDRTIRTIFTHDHFSPSTHQQAGLYAGLVTEPKGSVWRLDSAVQRNEPGTGQVTLPPGTIMGGWDANTGALFPGLPVESARTGLTVFDGGPTSWQALIQGPAVMEDELSFREFLFQVQDTTLMYEPFNKKQVKRQVGVCPFSTLPPDINPNRRQACTLESECPALPAGGCQPASLCSDGVAGLAQECTYDVDCQESDHHATCDTAGFCSNTGWCSNAPTTKRCFIAPPSSANTTLGLQGQLDEIFCGAGGKCQFALNNLVGCTTTNLSLCASGQLDPGAQLSHVESCNFVPGIPYTTWAAGYPFDTPSGVEVITFDNATNNFSFNYRDEPLESRYQGDATRPLNERLAWAYSSIPDRAVSSADLCTLYGAPCRFCSDNGQACTPSDLSNCGAGAFCSPYRPLTPGVEPGDPFTPLVRAYPGDDIQLRTLVGAHVNPHNFTIHGVNWPFEPSFVDSGWRNSEVMGISEHFEFLFKMPPIYSRGDKEHPWADFLYQPGAAAIEQSSGQWGLMRAYNSLQFETGSGSPEDCKTPSGTENPSSDDCTLFALPQNPPPFERALTCPQQADDGSLDCDDPTVQCYDVVAVNQPLDYNSTSPLSISDSNGMIFAHHKTGSVDACAFGGGDEPLVLRAAAGDCIQVNLRNCLVTDTVNATPGVTFSPTATNPINAANLNPVTSKVAVPVGLRPQLVSYDVRDSDGSNVGFNPPSTVDPGEQKTYIWFAGHFHPGTTAELGKRAAEAGDVWLGKEEQYIPIEFGAANLLPPDPLNHYQHGLFGGLIIEPKTARPGIYRCQDVEVECKDCGWQLDPGSQTVAKVTYVDESDCEIKHFREFVIFQQDDLTQLTKTSQTPTSNSGLLRNPNAVNYKSEYLRDHVQRFCTQDQCQTYLNGAGNAAGNNVFQDVSCMLSESPPKELWCPVPNGASPPTACQECSFEIATPTFRACAGEQVRMRLLHPGGTNTNEVFELFGHTFSEAPYMTRPEGGSCEAKLMHVNLASSQIIGSANLCGSSDWLLDDPPRNFFPWDESLNEWKGSRMGQGPSNHFDLVVDEAGGVCKRAGDYLYRSYSIFHFNQGMWGIFRVEDDKSYPTMCKEPVTRPEFCVGP